MYTVALGQLVPQLPAHPVCAKRTVIHMTPTAAAVATAMAAIRLDRRDAMDSS
jgi:hypothetical protein